MASKRHGKVTRQARETVYILTYMTADGKKTEERTAHGDKSVADLMALEADRLAKRRELVLDVSIKETGVYLYGMPEDAYFSQAVKLARVE